MIDQNENENSFRNDLNFNIKLNNEIKLNSSLSSSTNEFSSDESNFNERNFLEEKEKKSILKKNFNEIKLKTNEQLKSSSIYFKIYEKHRSKSLDNLSSRNTNENSSKIQINFSSISIECFLNSKFDFQIYFQRNQNQKQNRVTWSENQQEFHLNHFQSFELFSFLF